MSIYNTSPDDFVYTHLNAVIERIDAAIKLYKQKPSSVKLVAVSKHQPIEKIIAAIQGGQRVFGENYLQEALQKIAALQQYDLEWHFIGAIQSKKTTAIASHFDWVHSVCDKKCAKRLSDQRPQHLPPLNVCIQVNIDEETSKAGILAPEALPLAQFISTLPRLKLRGLMAIPKPAKEFEEQRKPFKALVLLLEKIKASGLALDTLSMGMSNDLEAAIVEGATLVRVGTDIFGLRERTIRY